MLEYSPSFESHSQVLNFAILIGSVFLYYFHLDYSIRGLVRVQGGSVVSIPKIMVGIAALSLLFVLSCGDGDSDSSRPPSVDVTGSWSGSWSSNNGIDGGSASLSAVQADASVSGSAFLSGSPCLSNGSFTGTVSGDRVSGSIRAGNSRIEISMNVSGNQASGTYYSANAGICTGDRGTLTLSR